MYIDICTPRESSRGWHRGRLEGRKGFINGDRVEGRINSSLAEKAKLEWRWGDFKGRWDV